MKLSVLYLHLLVTRGDILQLTSSGFSPFLTGMSSIYHSEVAASDWSHSYTFISLIDRFGAVIWLYYLAQYGDLHPSGKSCVCARCSYGPLWPQLPGETSLALPYLQDHIGWIQHSMEVTSGWITFLLPILHLFQYLGFNLDYNGVHIDFLQKCPAPAPDEWNESTKRVEIYRMQSLFLWRVLTPLCRSLDSNIRSNHTRPKVYHFITL